MSTPSHTISGALGIVFPHPLQFPKKSGDLTFVSIIIASHFVNMSFYDLCKLLILILIHCIRKPPFGGTASLIPNATSRISSLFNVFSQCGSEKSRLLSLVLKRTGVLALKRADCWFWKVPLLALKSAVVLVLKRTDCWFWKVPFVGSEKCRCFSSEKNWFWD